MILPWLEQGRLPDWLIRAGIRRNLKAKLAAEADGGPTAVAERQRVFLAMLDAAPIAVHTQEANEQHYELPPEFFRLVLGPRLKYSCALYEAPDGGAGKMPVSAGAKIPLPAAGNLPVSNAADLPVSNAAKVMTLGAAEEAMLRLYEERADLADGQSILELGCGWGSLTLWMAERFPKAEITAVSNSAPQREFIQAECARRGLKPVTIITRDMNDFDPGRRFDRIVSVEMFEHMRNYRQLLQRVSRWLEADGRLFVHIFTHVRYGYFYEAGPDAPWIDRHFFSGGTMPPENLFDLVTNDLNVEAQWRVNGTHYGRTARTWLDNMDRNENRVRPLLARTYGPGQEDRWWNYWRVFFMACEELWNYRNGTEWVVSHYRLAPARS